MNVDTAKLIADVVAELDVATIRKPRVTIAKAEMRAADRADLFEAIVQSGARTAIDLTGRYPLSNLVEMMEGSNTRRLTNGMTSCMWTTGW